MILLLMFILQLRYSTEPIDTNAPIDILCGTNMGTSFTTQFHLPQNENPVDGMNNAFFYFTKENFLINFDEEVHKDEILELSLDNSDL